jgi:DNA end-binding protein Ku
MVMETLRYADEVNKAASYFRDIGDDKPDEDLLDLAQTLIDKKSGKFDAGEFHDRYVDALKELIERKKKGKTISIEEEKDSDPRGSNVVDLMAALKKSLGSGGSSASSARGKDTAKAPTTKKAAPAKKASAKPAAKAPARKRA